MAKVKKPVILNSEGKPLTLTNTESFRAQALEKTIRNSLGFEVDITTLTTIIKKVTDQKFHEIDFANYLPVRLGNGAWSADLTTYRSFSLGGNFENGLLNTGKDQTRLAMADAGVDTLTVPVKNWAKGIGWNLMELNMASKSGNWDLVTSKEKSRKKNWDLGLQRIAFLGLDSDDTVNGLFTQSGIISNLTTITKAISAMTGAELKVFVAKVLDDYRANCARTAWPTHFVIPESDYLGLAGPSDANFHLKSTMGVLLETFQTMTNNKNFQIKSTAYGDNAYSGLGVQRYALYNSEEESLRMDIPVDYTSTLANSVDNFSFNNVAYGQFTGALAYRPKEMLYFDY